LGVLAPKASPLVADGALLGSARVAFSDLASPSPTENAGSAADYVSASPAPKAGQRRDYAATASVDFRQPEPALLAAPGREPPLRVLAVVSGVLVRSSAGSAVEAGVGRGGPPQG